MWGIVNSTIFKYDNSFMWGIIISTTFKYGVCEKLLLVANTISLHKVTSYMHIVRICMCTQGAWKHCMGNRLGGTGIGWKMQKTWPCLLPVIQLTLLKGPIVFKVVLSSFLVKLPSQLLAAELKTITMHSIMVSNICMCHQQAPI